MVSGVLKIAADKTAERLQGMAFASGGDENSLNFENFVDIVERGQT